MIRTENISYSINGKKLLNHISVDFQPNEISMILGPNGAGKSTLIKLLSRQIKADNGKILTNKKVLDKIPKKKLAKTQAVLSQNIQMVFPLKVKEVVMMGRYPHFSSIPQENDRDICRAAMDLFDVRELSDRNYLTLSGGERQRVHFARVAAQIWPENNNSTKTLLLDEPLTFLDFYYQLDFMEKLRTLMKKQPMIVVGVVHDLNLAYKYSDKVVFIKSGQIFSQGKKAKVFTPNALKEVFKLDAKFILNEGKPHLLLYS